jgi:group II intron reverse transcriptase/maturase
MTTPAEVNSSNSPSEFSSVENGFGESMREAGKTTPTTVRGRVKWRSDGVQSRRVSTDHARSEVFRKQGRIARLARDCPDIAFTNLAHNIDADWLFEAYRLTRKNRAVGKRGGGGMACSAKMKRKLQSLLTRAKSGTYRVPPARRVFIPKAGSTTDTRPIDISAFEDKVFQRAVLMVLQPVYEQDFMDCSYAYRPGRFTLGALEALRQQVKRIGGGWMLEVDITNCFGSIDHTRMLNFLRLRLRDRALLRLIGKWLKAGVVEEGHVTCRDRGLAQGGVLSPTLANVFLHYVLDVWFERELKPRLIGRSFMIRYADDIILGFAVEADARRVFDVLPSRIEEVGLRVHPKKTRLVAFLGPGMEGSAGHAVEASGANTFDFLGFTHYWARSAEGISVARVKIGQSLSSHDEYAERSAPTRGAHREVTRATV